jgi:isopropylmalate/homocitrate/citramalate synthase
LERRSVTGPVTALKKIRDRDPALVSVHRHNDRGTAVAAAEFAVMAGADHGEWAPLRNGERSGRCRRPTAVRLCNFHRLVGGYPLTWIENLMERFPN